MAACACTISNTSAGRPLRKWCEPYTRNRARARTEAGKAKGKASRVVRMQRTTGMWMHLHQCLRLYGRLRRRFPPIIWWGWCVIVVPEPCLCVRINTNAGSPARSLGSTLRISESSTCTCRGCLNCPILDTHARHALYTYTM